MKPNEEITMRLIKVVAEQLEKRPATSLREVQGILLDFNISMLATWVGNTEYYRGASITDILASETHKTAVKELVFNMVEALDRKERKHAKAVRREDVEGILRRSANE